MSLTAEVVDSADLRTLQALPTLAINEQTKKAILHIVGILYVYCYFSFILRNYLGFRRIFFCENTNLSAKIPQQT